jgi:mono/diheme cytochrome c family protein
MRGVWAALVIGMMLLIGTAVGSAQKRGGDPKAAAVKNPVPATQASITAGARAYGRNCRQCHGFRGKGDGPLAPKNPSPADFTDDKWEFGSSDGELFAVIWNGVQDVKDSEMKPMKGTLKENDVWTIINYLRTLNPKTAGK